MRWLTIFSALVQLKRWPGYVSFPFQLCFALSILGSPTVMLWDEPSAGMDEAGQRCLWWAVPGCRNGWARKGSLVAAVICVTPVHRGWVSLTRFLIRQAVSLCQLCHLCQDSYWILTIKKIWVDSIWNHAFGRKDKNLLYFRAWGKNRGSFSPPSFRLSVLLSFFYNSFTWNGKIWIVVDVTNCS